jgi:hypothetical protein
VEKNRWFVEGRWLEAVDSRPEQCKEQQAVEDRQLLAEAGKQARCKL